MTLKSFLPWLTRSLAFIGLIAIVVVGVQYFFIRFKPYATTSSYGGYDMVASESVTMLEEKSLRAQSPDSYLYDEAIAAEVDQKIIKTGNLDLVVDHADESLAVVESVATGVGGYVQNSTLQEHKDGTKSGYSTVRVPADQFDTVMEQLKALALLVERETSSAEDVTEQYIDLAARLKNAQAQEGRYVEILDRANTVEEILQIESALGNIRGYIESLQGQIQYLDSLTGFSTITVSLSEEPVITVGGKEFRPGTSMKQAAQAVVAIAQTLVVAIIWIVVVGAGVGVPLALIVWLVWKGVMRIKLWRK